MLQKRSRGGGVEGQWGRESEKGKSSSEGKRDERTLSISF